MGESFHFVQEWYESATEDHFWMKERFAFLEDAFRRTGLSRSTPLRALDIGSGNGVVRAQIEGSTAWMVDCADIDAKAIQSLPAGRGKSFVYDIHERRAELAMRYDVVLLLDILEHVEEPEAFLDAAVHHLRPAGHLILNVPAMQFLYSQYDEQVGHHRRYDRSSLRKELARLPMQTVFESYWGLTMMPLLMVRKFLVSTVRGPERAIQIGFKPQAEWINRLLGAVLQAELKAIRKRPWGTSLIYIGKRSAGPCS